METAKFIKLYNTDNKTIILNVNHIESIEDNQIKNNVIVITFTGCKHFIKESLENIGNLINCNTVNFNKYTNITIKNCNQFSVRVKNVLHAYKIEYVNDLLNLDMIELEQMLSRARNCGKHTKNEIMNFYKNSKINQ